MTDETDRAEAQQDTVQEAPQAPALATQAPAAAPAAAAPEAPAAAAAAADAPDAPVSARAQADALAAAGGASITPGAPQAFDPPGALVMPAVAGDPPPVGEARVTEHPAGFQIREPAPSAAPALADPARED